MKIEINTDNVKSWLTTHLNYVLPLGFGYASWFFAVLASNLDHGMMVWYGMWCVVFGVFALILGTRAIHILLGIIK